MSTHVPSPRTGTLGGLLVVGLAALALVGCGGQQQAESVVTVTATASAMPSASAGGTPSSATSVQTTPLSSAAAATGPATEPAAKDVQGLLQQLNYDIELTGTYDAPTRAALKKFQAKRQMPTTGQVDAATRAALLTAVATFSPEATTDSSGLTFDGVWWSAGTTYRSRERSCVVYEQQWQDAVEAGRKSASVEAHDAAAAMGCEPDVWSPRNISHPKVDETHVDGESCTSAQGGTIATGSNPVAICNQVSEGVWRWKQASN